MKYQDIKKFKIIDGCFGKNIILNDQDVETLEIDTIRNIIITRLMIFDDKNLMISMLEDVLLNSPFELVDSSYDTCDQCGHPCSEETYESYPVNQDEADKNDIK